MCARVKVRRDMDGQGGNPQVASAAAAAVTTPVPCSVPVAQAQETTSTGDAPSRHTHVRGAGTPVPQRVTPIPVPATAPASPLAQPSPPCTSGSGQSTSSPVSAQASGGTSAFGVHVRRTTTTPTPTAGSRRIFQHWGPDDTSHDALLTFDVNADMDGDFLISDISPTVDGAPHRATAPSAFCIFNAASWVPGVVIDATRVVLQGNRLLCEALGAAKRGTSAFVPFAVLSADKKRFEEAVVLHPAHWVPSGQALHQSVVATLEEDATRKMCTYAHQSLERKLEAISCAQPTVRCEEAQDSRGGPRLFRIVHLQDMPAHLLHLLHVPRSAVDAGPGGTNPAGACASPALALVPVSAAEAPLAHERLALCWLACGKWCDRAGRLAWSATQAVAMGVVVALAAAGAFVAKALLLAVQVAFDWNTYAIEDHYTRLFVSVGATFVGLLTFVLVGAYSTKFYQTALWALVYLPEVACWGKWGFPLPFTKITGDSCRPVNNYDGFLIAYVVAVVVCTLVFTVLLTEWLHVVSHGMAALFFCANALVWIGAAFAMAFPWVQS